MRKKLLVIGAKPYSLGWHIAVRASAFEEEFQVVTAGIEEEDMHLDLRFQNNIVAAMSHGWDHVVCTAGVNVEGGSKADNVYSMDINYIGVMDVLNEWLARRPVSDITSSHFVAISSNSAHVARSQSTAYCASKAALSMGIRSMARQFANYPVTIYAYEPGWMNGTPMSQAVQERLDRMALHRIPGNRVVDPEELANMVVSNIVNDYRWLNGTCLRVDGGEQ